MVLSGEVCEVNFVVVLFLNGKSLVKLFLGYGSIRKSSKILNPKINIAEKKKSK